LRKEFKENNFVQTGSELLNFILRNEFFGIFQHLKTIKGLKGHFNTKSHFMNARGFFISTI